MTFLPVLERELRVAARRPQLFWTRLGFALGAAGVFAWIWLNGKYLSGRSILGEELFYPILLLGFAAVLLTGGGAPAECICEEKREGTLGLLFLTDLRGYDVVAGKFAAVSIYYFYALAAILPVLGTSVLLGGVTGAEFFRASLLLLNTLFFSVSLGLFASSLAVSDARARVLFASILLLLEGIVPSIASSAPSLHRALQFVPDLEYLREPRSFWESMAAAHALGWALLAAAGFRTARSWRHNPSNSRPARRWARTKGWQEGSATARKEYRQRLLERGAYFWRAARYPARPVTIAGLVLLLAGGWLLLAIASQDLFDPVGYLLLAWVLHVFLRVVLVINTVRVVHEDSAAGGWELVLSGPLQPKEIRRGIFGGVRRDLGWALALVLLADAGMCAESLGRFSWFLDWVYIWGGSVFFFVLDLETLSWLSMSLALAKRRAFQAAAGAIFRVLILPWILYMGGLAIYGALHGLSFGMFEGVVLGVLTVMLDLYFILTSRKRIYAALRPGTPPS